jgi:hypothetical protein
MRILGLALTLTVALAAFGLDVGESLRLGTITDASAHAKRHHRHHRKHARHRRHKHHAPASEM